jgi:beta-glucanase (GH16 family)
MLGFVPVALLALGGCASAVASTAPDPGSDGSEALRRASRHHGRGSVAPPSSQAHEKDGYTLTFLDEFDGVSEDDPTRGKTDLYFDRTKWTSGFLPLAFDQDNGGDGSRYLAGNGEQQLYLDKDYAGNGIPPDQRINPFFVHDSMLEIESGYVPDALQDGYWIGGYRVFYSGVLCTARKFSQKYGLFEIKMKAAPGIGAWPAFWLLPEVSSLDDNHWPPEIDVLEEFPLLHRNQTHWATQGDDGAGDWADMPGGSDVSDDFHVYGVEWTESTLTWFVDGQQIASAPNNVNEPMYLLVNVAVGGTWYAGETGHDSWDLDPLVDTYRADPSQMPYRTQFDWVRVYTKNCCGLQQERDARG